MHPQFLFYTLFFFKLTTQKHFTPLFSIKFNPSYELIIYGYTIYGQQDVAMCS